MTVDLVQIRNALRTLPEMPLREGAGLFFRSLGYDSDRTARVGAVEDFLRQYEASELLTGRQQELFQNWERVEIVFQITEEEFSQTVKGVSDAQFNSSYIKSMLFLAVEIHEPDCNRTYFVECVRAINRLFLMPVIVLYRHGKHITLGVVHRRLHKLDRDRDVLERVTLVKDIDASDPHRAHLEILADLSRVRFDPAVTSFDALLRAWEDKLDIDQLNQRFYRDLFAWFGKAVRRCKFPNDGAGDGSEERHIIRLITRLMFIWFLREKGVVPNKLFDESFAQDVLISYDRSQTHYYRAILQNLFFGTLNTERDKRGFLTAPANAAATGSYRYRSLMAKPEDVLGLLQSVPFVNGGLFTCLDDGASTTEAPPIALDMFIEDCRAPRELTLHVPAGIFFDLDEGLFPVLRRYKFTVEENTPLDREIALDPELLGRVFENLLAAYDPETKVHARRATGSYYTPRPVVEYMAAETIALALSAKLRHLHSQKSCLSTLRQLADESREMDVAACLSPRECRLIVGCVADLAILDPAVGSGAFLMSMLHTLIVVLRRLDPDGVLWLEAQRNRDEMHLEGSGMVDKEPSCDATKSSDVQDAIRQLDLADYYRKLHLIQNSLFGVDILPTACQIAKLRFFISLAIEQTSYDNYTVDKFVPLPNLETRIIAADALVFEQDQQTLGLPGKNEIDQALRENRRRYFRANTNDEKRRCLAVDKDLRQKLAFVLKEGGVADEFAARMAAWNPYDSNVCANWFEPEYMFGKRQFDVVIGNPPYIQLQKDGGRLRLRYQSQKYQTFAATGDIYQLFIERGISLLTVGGILGFITSNSWLKAKYGQATREYLATEHSPLQVIEMGKDVFSNTIVDTSILVVRKGQHDGGRIKAIDLDGGSQDVFPPRSDEWNHLRLGGKGPWFVVSRDERRIMERMENAGRPLREWDIAIYRGILTGCNDAFIVGEDVRDRLISEDPSSADLLKPILRGRDIRRYRARWDGLWLIDTHNGFDDTKPVDVDMFPAIRRHLENYLERLVRRQDQGVTPFNLRNCAYHELFKSKKMFWMDMSPEGRFAISREELYCNDKGYFMTGPNLEHLCGYLNSALMKWYITKTTLTTGVGLPQWKKFVVEATPVPPLPSGESRIIQLVNSLSDFSDTLSSEQLECIDDEIDKLVCESYGLGSSEIRFIQGFANDCHSA